MDTFIEYFYNSIIEGIRFINDFIVSALPHWNLDPLFYNSLVYGLSSVAQFDEIFPVPDFSLWLYAIQIIVIFEITFFSIRIILKVVNFVRGVGGLGL